MIIFTFKFFFTIVANSRGNKGILAIKMFCYHKVVIRGTATSSQLAMHMMTHRIIGPFLFR